MRLTPAQIAALLAAMENGFDPLDMQRLLLERFGLKMHSLTSYMLKFSAQVVDIHAHFDHRNTSEQLVAALRDARPAEPTFVALADALGFTVLPAMASLEVMVRKTGSPYQEVVDFRTALAKREDTVCRVETPTGYGTAVLDGNGALKGTLTCLFDHKKSSQAYVTPARRVKVVRVPVSSPPAGEDYKPLLMATDPERLDYALLELDESVGEQPIVPGGDVRGFVSMPPDDTVPAIAAGLVILQHPLSQPMKIDIGSVTAQSGTRLRHSVNTDKGSSGAPVFDAGLRLVALHHAGFDWPTVDFPYNQAVPVALIRAHAQARGMVI